MPPTPKQAKYINRFFTGLYTQRSPLVTPFTFAGAGLHIIEKDDALVDGVNVEQTNQMTYARRPGWQPWLAAALASGQILRNAVTWSATAGLTQMLDLATGIGYVAPGGTSITPLSADTSGTPYTGFQPVGANVIYYTPNPGPKKWTGSGSETAWGIAGPTLAPSVAVAANASGLSPTVGYQYTYCFVNSATGHVSNGAPLGTSTGPQSQAQFTVTGGTTSDPQVTGVQIYRTTDGGGIPYYVATVAYAPGWSYVDTTPDTNLNTALAAPMDAQNSPPPVGLSLPVWHMGCLWGIVGSKVYFSGGAAITNGVPEECFPPLNFFQFPEPVIALVPSPRGLQVWLRDAVYLIGGTDVYSFTPMVWAEGMGVLDPRNIACDGGTVYVFTSRCQLFALDPSGTSTEIGFPIGDVLNGLSPSSVVLAVHRASSIDAALYVSDGASYLYRYSLTLGAWATKATVPTGAAPGFLTSLETSAGTWQLILGLGPAAQLLYARTPGTNTDNGTGYDAQLTLGSIVLAALGDIVNLEYVSTTLRNAAATVTLAVMRDEVGSPGVFTGLTAVNEPPEFTPTQSIASNRWYVSGSNVSSLLRHVQVLLDFGSGDDAGELLELAFVTNTPALNAPPGVF